MLGRYAELPRDADGLSGHFRAPNAVDADGKFVLVDGRVTITFGKCRGQSLAATAEAEPGYLEWMLRQDFAEDAKAVIRQALAAAEA